MAKITHKVIAVSEGKTYRETLKCTSEAEANAYAEQLRAEGWTVTIKPV